MISRHGGPSVVTSFELLKQNCDICILLRKFCNYTFIIDVPLSNYTVKYNFGNFKTTLSQRDSGKTSI